MSDADNRRRLFFLESVAASAGAKPGKEKESSGTGNLPRSLERTNGPARTRSNQNIAPLGEKQNKLRQPGARVLRPALHDGTGPILSLPGRRRRRSYATLISFVACVVLPTLIAGIYYTFIAANQYVAEFRFSVTDNSSSSVPTSTSSSVSGLTSLLGGVTTSSSQNYLVSDFLTSRQAVEELQRRVDLRKLYSRPIADWWSRFDATKPIEKLVPYWQSMVTSSYDQVTGLATAEVRAFTPEDAELIAKTLVSLAEGLVNEIATRPQKDAVKYAEAEVRRAESSLKVAQAKLDEYRNKQSVIDPTNSVVMANVTTAQTLRSSLVQLETQMSSLLQQQINRNSPAIQVLQSRINATKAQLADVESQISKNSGKDEAISKVVSLYEGLILDRTFAQNMVTSTMSTLEAARANAAAQHLYITPYVRPSLPQSATYPKRFQTTFLVALVSIMIWLCLLLFYRSVREHL